MGSNTRVGQQDICRWYRIKQKIRDKKICFKVELVDHIIRFSYIYIFVAVGKPY